MYIVWRDEQVWARQLRSDLFLDHDVILSNLEGTKRGQLHRKSFQTRESLCSNQHHGKESTHSIS